MKKGVDGEEPAPSAMPLSRESFAPEGRQSDIDENSRFYDWRGQALSGHERRARLEAFRTGSPSTSGHEWPRSDERPSERPALIAEHHYRPIEAEHYRPIEAEQFPSIEQLERDAELEAPEVVHTPSPNAEVEADFFESSTAPHLFTTRSDAPVVAPPRRERSNARSLYLGLFAATVLLVLISIVGLLGTGSSPAGSRAERTSAVLAPPAPTPIVGPSADKAANVANALPTPSVTATAATAPEPAPPAIEPTSAASQAALAADPKPAPVMAAPPPRAQNRPTNSTSSLPSTIVPSDTPKF
ncbi:MAG TPA: hypothetical protein VGL13_02485 [Polyangiaceae bacterium]